MIKQHPTTDLLAEYTAGSLPWAQAICITTHLYYCVDCQRQIEHLNGVGAEMMAHQPDTELDDSVLASVLTRIDQSTMQNHEAELKTEAVVTTCSSSGLPRVVDRLIEKNGVHWKKISSGLKVAPLKAGDKQHEVALHKIAAGSKVAEHDHRATEITVVLRGSFSDEDGVYSVGDFLLREPGEVHRPMAAQNEDCLCLSAQQAPIRLTGAWRWINPFLRIQPG